MLFTEEEVLEQVLAAAVPVGQEAVSLPEALDRVLGEQVVAKIALPRFDNSTMDGYALQAGSGPAGARLKVTGEQPAGLAHALAVEPGTCVRIFTGAPVPSGADAVIMQEDVERQSGEILVREPVIAGENIRRRGGDLAEGQKIAGPGTVLTAPLLAVLASQGRAEVRVFRRPRVAILATGSELRQAEEALGPGEIYESNRVMLAGLVRREGGLPEVFEVVPDDQAQHRAVLERAGACDLIVVAGGMSVGEKDFVRPALEELGAPAQLWRVAVKPGKPFLLAQLGQSPVFGLPGNPVSAYVTFLLFVRPALWRASGRAEVTAPRIQVQTGEPLVNRGDRPHYLRGRMMRDMFYLTGKQESHALFALAQADALVRLDPNQEVPAGSSVWAIPLR